jgi:streptogramin lyase
MRRLFPFVFGLLLLGVAPPLGAASRDLGRGFLDHGVATPTSQHRGMAATRDGDGRDVMLVWLYDHRGAYALLMIDAETGRTQEFPTPYPWAGDGPFASLLSSRGKYYTHFGSHFSEFDPAKRTFTFFRKTAPQMAMSLTEADDGTIWSATYPNCGLASYQPAIGEFRDHGSINRENWRQYPRGIAVDDAGWVYVAVGSTAGQILMFDPRARTASPLLETVARQHGYPTVQRDLDGAVYAHLPGAAAQGWWRLHRGNARPLDVRPRLQPKPVLAGDQGLFHSSFPSGRRAKLCDTVTRKLLVEDPATGATRSVSFDYTSEGAHVVAVAATPDGAIAGGTAFPMRMFRFDPRADAWTNWPAYGQFNTVARQGDRFFIGGYGGGFLLEWDPAAPWAQTVKGRAAANPRFLTECAPTINRPHDLLACPDGHTLVLAGTPGYGYTGGGLLFWDRTTQKRTLLEHTDLLPQLSTMSLAALPEGKLLGGTTTAAGTGGETKAQQAELYALDIATRKIEWHAPVLPGVQTYTDLCAGPRGLVYGFADRSRFFVFDPVRRTVVHDASCAEKFGAIVTGQGPRALLPDGAGHVLVLFARGIVRIDAATFALDLLANSPVTIQAGGDVLDGRLYFASGSHMFSFGLPR